MVVRSSARPVARQRKRLAARRSKQLRSLPRTLTLESLEARQVFASLADFRLADGWNEVQRPSSGDIQPGLVKIQEDLDLVRLVQRFSDQELLQLDKVDRSLLKLYGQWLDNPQINPLSDLSPNANDWSSELVVDQQRPYVKFFVDDAQQAAGELSKLGMEIEHVTDTESWQIVMGYLPVDRIGDAAKLTGLATLAAGVAPEQNTEGIADNLWETISHSDQLTRMFGADGTGIDIGVISDSINQKAGGIQDSQDSGDLPSSDSRVRVLEDGVAGDTDEGRAMTELMYDVGNGFDFLFHTGDSSGAMEDAFGELVAAGADVIVDDMSFFDEPVFQDGPIAQAIDNTFYASGVLMFGSAGNANGNTYLGTFTDTDGDGYHEFSSGGDETINITVAAGGKTDFYLQWSDPWGDAASDVDVEVWNSTITTKLFDSNESNTGANPFDAVSIKNSSTSSQSFHVAIRHVGGASSIGDSLHLMTRNTKNATTFNDSYMQDNLGISGNHAAASMFTIGATSASSIDTLRSYSSHGPVQIEFEDDGTPLSSTSRRYKPDFVAVDGVNTSFFGTDSSADSDALPNFFGTSAAAPNTAAVAGLLLDLAGGAGSLTFGQLNDLLRETADRSQTVPSSYTTHGDWNEGFGYGRINALGAAMVIRGMNASENYAELNPFGEWSYSTTLYANGDVDSFVFAPENIDDPVEIRVDGTTLDTGLVLWRHDTEEFVDIDYNSDGFDPVISRSMHRAPYQAEVYSETDIASSTSAAYTVAIATATPNNSTIAISLLGDGDASADLATTTDVDYFKFKAPAGAIGQLTVDLDADSTLQGVLSLYDSSGNRLDRIEGAYRGDSLTMEYSGVVAGETYYLRVGSYHYESSGAFDLTLAMPVAPATLTGEVFLDANANRHLDSLETGLEGWIVYVDADDDGSRDAGVASGSSTDTPKSIPTMASTTSSISVSMPAGTVVTDVNVTLTISHNRLSDVDAYLVSPTGVRIELFTDVGAMLNGGLDHVTLDDSAATSIAAATSGPMTPITGTYRPEGSLAEFIGGEESGTWHLELSDDLSSFSGTLESWSLEVSYSEPYAVSDAAGNYSLDVVPGDIRLREETPAGWTLTSPRIGHRDISVVGGETRSNLNFGNYENTTVSGLKFHDQDGDGVQDSTEPGLSDWVIYLDANNNGLRDNGADAISAVPVVDIPDDGVLNSTMTLTAPSGVVLTDLDVTLNISHGNDADLDIVLVSPWGERVTLLTDVGGTGNNFTNTTLDSAFGSSLLAVGSAPFTGTFRPEESLSVLNGHDPSGDWTLEVTDDNGNGVIGMLVSWVLSYDYSEPFDTTDSSGNYEFTDVAPGRYELREEMQDGWLQTAPARGAYLINATSGSEFTKKAFGNTQPVAMEGFAFHDRTANGMYDGSDYGSAFWPVYVDLNHNAVRDQFVTTLAATGLPQSTRDGATVMSSINATSLYGKVLDVNVTVDLTHATDSELTLWLVSPQGTTVQLVSATGGSGNNFTSTKFDDGASTAITSGAAPFTGSFRPTESLSSLINQNANGVWMLQIKDSGGVGTGTLNSWSLEITSGDPSTTTDLYGDYSFDGLTPGTYIVREEPVSGWFQTAPVAPLFHTVTLASGDTATNVAFGNSMFATIEGYVYVDTNGNGARDMGEGPLYNWTVYIDANGNGALDAGERRTTSDATGYYSIGNLRAGTYTVREVLQAGWKETEPAIGYRTVVLTSGARASNENFGNQPPAKMAMAAPSSPPPSSTAPSSFAPSSPSGAPAPALAPTSPTAPAPMPLGGGSPAAPPAASPASGAKHTPPVGNWSGAVDQLFGTGPGAIDSLFPAFA